MSDALPPIDELLAEFDSGKIPRSDTWHTLITGLYLVNEQVDDIQGWYEQIQDLTEHNQNLANDIKAQYGQIEIWYGEVDGWQQQVSQNTQLTEQYRDEAKASELAAKHSEQSARNDATLATQEADRAKQEGINAVNNIQQTAETENDRLLATGASERNDITDTGQQQVGRVTATGDSQNARLISTGDSQNSRLTSTGTAQEQRVTDEGDQQVARLATEGNSQVSRAKAEADRSKTEADRAEAARTGAETAETNAEKAAADAAAIAYEGEASLEPAPGKLAIADSTGKFHPQWIPPVAIPEPDFHLPLVNDLHVKAGLGMPVTFTRDTKGTCLDKFTGTIAEIEKDQPRFENSGVLIEGSGTNLFPYSSLNEVSKNQNWYFYGGSWDEFITGQPSITGDNTAAKWIAGSDGVINGHFGHTPVDMVKDKTYTYSVYIKPETSAHNHIRLQIVNGTINSFGTVTNASFHFYTDTLEVRLFDVKTGSYKLEQLPSGWVRASVTYQYLGENVTAQRKMVYFWQDANTILEPIFLDGLQLEPSPIPTSYIPTSGTAVTRTYDSLLAKDVYIPEEYTMTMLLDWGHVPQPGDTRRYYQWFLKDLATNNMWGMFVNPNGIYHSIHIDGNSSTYSMGFPRPATPDEAKGRFTIVQTATDVTYYFRDDVTTYQLGSDSVGRVSFLTGHCRLSLGSDHNGTASQLYGNIRDVRIWNHALTDNQIYHLGGTQ